MPVIIEVKQNDENWQRHAFDDKTACKVLEDAVGEEDDERSTYTFYVNVDNLFLKTDMKGAADDVAVMKAKFIYGNVLVGLALIHDHRNRQNGGRQERQDDAVEETIEGLVDRTTRAMGPFLVPMIDYLGALSAEEVASMGQVGDEE
jgi:hypothetical protein